MSFRTVRLSERDKLSNGYEMCRLVYSILSDSTHPTAAPPLDKDDPVPLWGELGFSSIYKIYRHWQWKYGFSNRTHYLLDAGSGPAKTVAAAIHGFGVSGCGIEYSVDRHQNAVDWNKELTAALWKRHKIRRSIDNGCLRLINGDLEQLTSLGDVTHIYMFDKSYPAAIYEKMAPLFNASQKARFIASTRDPDTMIKHFGFNVVRDSILAEECEGSDVSLPLPSSITVSQVGGNATHTMYMYVKPGTQVISDASERPKWRVDLVARSRSKHLTTKLAELKIPDPRQQTTGYTLSDDDQSLNAVSLVHPTALPPPYSKKRKRRTFDEQPIEAPLLSSSSTTTTTTTPIVTKIDEEETKELQPVTEDPESDSGNLFDNILFDDFGRIVASLPPLPTTTTTITKTIPTMTATTAKDVQQLAHFDVSHIISLNKQ